MALLDFMRKGAPDRDGSEAPLQPDIMYLDNGVGVGVVRYDHTIAAKAAMQHPIVFRAIDKIASTVDQIPWKVVEDHRISESIRSTIQNKEDLIESLQCTLNDPNDEMTPSMLRYWMSVNWSCYGRVPLRFSWSNINKAVNGIFPLEARHVHVSLNKKGTAESYMYGVQENQQKFLSRSTFKGQREGFVHQIWRPGIKGYQDREDSNSPMRAIGLPAEVITSLLLRAVQTAKGHPNVRYMVSCSKTLSREQKEAVRQHLNKEHAVGGNSSGQIPVLQNASDLVIHKLDNDLSDIHTKTPADDMARLVFGAFGIPIALAGIGASDAGKFSGNYNESRASFIEDTVIPAHITPMMNGLTQAMCPLGLKIVPDLVDHPSLQPARVTAMRNLASVSFLTTNEKRAMFSYDDAPDGFEEHPNKDTTVDPNGGKDV